MKRARTCQSPQSNINHLTEKQKVNTLIVGVNCSLFLALSIAEHMDILFEGDPAIFFKYNFNAEAYFPPTCSQLGCGKNVMFMFHLHQFKLPLFWSTVSLKLPDSNCVNDVK